MTVARDFNTRAARPESNPLQERMPTASTTPTGTAFYPQAPFRGGLRGSVELLTRMASEVKKNIDLASHFKKIFPSFGTTFILTR